MLMDLLGVLTAHIEASKNSLSNEIQIAFLSLGAHRPREVDGPGDAGAAREDEGAPLEEEGATPEDDAPGAKVDA